MCSISEGWELPVSGGGLPWGLEPGTASTWLCSIEATPSRTLDPGTTILSYERRHPVCSPPKRPMSSVFGGLRGFKFGVVFLLEEFPYMDSEPPLPSFWFWSDLLLGQLPARVDEPVLPGYLAHSWGLVCGHQGVSTHRWACMPHIWGPTSSESLYFSLGPFGAQFPPVATWRHYMGLVVERLFTGRRDWRVLLSFRVVLKRTVLASGEGWKREVISTKHPADTLDTTSHNLWQALY